MAPLWYLWAASIILDTKHKEKWGGGGEELPLYALYWGLSSDPIGKR